jgi:hypothetical protein
MGNVCVRGANALTFLSFSLLFGLCGGNTRRGYATITNSARYPLNFDFGEGFVLDCKGKANGNGWV